MTIEVSERSLEEAIECGLLQHGSDACAEDTTGFGAPPQRTYRDGTTGFYRRRHSEDYDRSLCLLPRDVADFVLATQPKEWQKLGSTTAQRCGSNFSSVSLPKSNGAGRSTCCAT